MGRTRTITSRDNPTVKDLRALATDAREIRRQGRTLLDGPHLLEASLRQGGVPELLVVNDATGDNAEIGRLLASCPDVDRLRLSDGLFRELSGVAAPVGILAVIPLPPAADGPILGGCVMLDAVQDAGNVGAILRTAAAAGIRDIALGPGCAGAWAPRVLRAGQGAHFGLRIREGADLGSLLGSYHGTSVATVARHGTSLFDLDLAGDIAWIFGNEGSGIAAAIAAAAARRVTIPLAAETESLNVAAAAAVCLFESMRQRICRSGRKDG